MDDLRAPKLYCRSPSTRLQISRLVITERKPFVELSELSSQSRTILLLTSNYSPWYTIPCPLNFYRRPSTRSGLFRIWLMLYFRQARQSPSKALSPCTSIHPAELFRQRGAHKSHWDQRPQYRYGMCPVSLIQLVHELRFFSRANPSYEEALSLAEQLASH